jgi:zinc protease
MMLQVLRIILFAVWSLALLVPAEAQTAFPQFLQATTDKGHRFLYLRSAAQDTAVVALAVEGGSVKTDFQGPLPGPFAVNLLLKGSEGQKAGEIIETMNDFGADFRFRQDAETVRIVVSAPSKGIVGAVRVANLVMRKPDFPQKAFDRELSISVAEAQERLRQPETQAMMAFVSALAEPHSYLNAIVTDPSRLAVTKREDVVAWHAKSFATKNASIVVVGDLDENAMKSLVDDLLAGFPDGDGRTPAKPLVTKQISGTPLKIKAGTGDSQSVIMLGALKPATRSAVELVQHSMLGYIYSDMQNSRLFMDTREKLGTTYGLSGSASDYRGIGAYIINGRVSKAGVDATLAALLESWRKFRKEGPTDEEIQGVKAAYGQWLSQLPRDHAGLAEFLRDHLARIGDFDAAANIFTTYMNADLKDPAPRLAMFAENPLILIAE